jgi:hypothetical protein
LADGEGTYDPFKWSNRTMHTARRWLEEHFDEVQTGDVVDVQFILEETDKPKVSERLEPYPPAPERIHAEGTIKDSWASALQQSPD